jgi:hypothetical protein
VGGRPAVRTVCALGPRLRALALHRRQCAPLPPRVGMGEPLLPRRPTGPPRRDGVPVTVGRLGDGGPRLALVAWLSAALLPTAGPETACAGLLHASAARGLAAVAAVCPPVGLESVHPGLEVEAESRQRPHQGQYGFFALVVGGMDLFWGRQTLGCPGLYDALVFSALHEGLMTLLVCLSSY